MSEQGQRAFAIHWCTTSYYTQMEVASPASRSRGGASTAPRTPLARRSHDPTILSPFARCPPGEALHGDHLLGRHEVRGHPHHHGLKLPRQKPWSLWCRGRNRYAEVPWEGGSGACADISRRGAMRGHPCECVENCVHPSTPVAAQERRLAHPQSVQTHAPLHHGTVGSAHTRRSLQRSRHTQTKYQRSSPSVRPSCRTLRSSSPSASLLKRRSDTHTTTGPVTCCPRPVAQRAGSGAGGRRRGGRGAGWGGAEKWMIGRRHGGPSFSRWL